MNFDMGYYTLDDDNNVVHIPSEGATLRDDGTIDTSSGVMQWSDAMEKLRRTKRNIVKQENVGQYWVSTVFLGLDHNFFRWREGGVPLLFETMVFEREDDEPTYVSNIFEKLRFSSDSGIDWSDIECSRCSTWEQAEEQHKATVRYVQEMTDQLNTILEGASDDQAGNARRTANEGSSEDAGTGG